MYKLTTILLGAAMLAGCQANKDQTAAHCDACLEQSPEKDLAFFSEERNQTPAVSRILARQVDNGAAADGMLRPAHFDGAALNSLGVDKLDAIVRGTAPNQPVAVYLDLPDNGDEAAAKQEAVIAYLSAKGIEDDRVQIQAGDNPATRHVATLTSSKRYKVEEGTLGSAEVADDSAATQTPAGPAGTPVPPAR